MRSDALKKIRRFSDIDFARFIALAGTPALRSALEKYASGGGSWSYEPVRNSTADLLGADTPLFGAVGVPPWKVLESQIARACKHGDAQVKANVQVGKVLHAERVRLNFTAVKFLLGRMPIGAGETVRYWSDVIVADKDGPFVPFFDHRRQHGITGPIQSVVFSMQNIWIRERHPDLASVRLAVVKFPTQGALRGMKIDFHTEADLMSYEELNSRAILVYELWAQILEEKTGPTRKKATGTQGLF